jgi:hypothetical protein
MSKPSEEINKLSVAPSIIPSLASNLKSKVDVFYLCLDKKIALYTPEFYLACAAGGALSCGLTHTLVTPLDLVKCRRQVKTKTRLLLFLLLHYLNLG